MALIETVFVVAVLVVGSAIALTYLLVHRVRRDIETFVGRQQLRAAARAEAARHVAAAPVARRVKRAASREIARSVTQCRTRSMTETRDESKPGN